jgi:hypothetical protein
MAFFTEMRQLVCHKGLLSAVPRERFAKPVNNGSQALKNKEPEKSCIALSTWKILSQDGKNFYADFPKFFLRFSNFFYNRLKKLRISAT